MLLASTPFSNPHLKHLSTISKYEIMSYLERDSDPLWVVVLNHIGTS
jgi:hypothetical protein